MIPPPVCLLAAALTVVVLAVCAVGAPWASGAAAVHHDALAVPGAPETVPGHGTLGGQ